LPGDAGDPQIDEKKSLEVDTRHERSKGAAEAIDGRQEELSAAGGYRQAARAYCVDELRFRRAEALVELKFRFRRADYPESFQEVESAPENTARRYRPLCQEDDGVAPEIAL
jgi:hypothetical protein